MNDYLNNEVLYILNNSDIWFKDEKNKKFKNEGLVNFIRIYKFIPDGITLVKTRRIRMEKKTKVTKAPAKKVTAKKIAKKAPAKKAIAKKPNTKK